MFLGLFQSVSENEVLELNGNISINPFLFLNGFNKFFE
jgi:hypothetical protein